MRATRSVGTCLAVHGLLQRGFEDHDLALVGFAVGPRVVCALAMFSEMTSSARARVERRDRAVDSERMSTISVIRFCR